MSERKRDASNLSPSENDDKRPKGLEITGFCNDNVGVAALPSNILDESPRPLYSKLPEIQSTATRLTREVSTTPTTVTTTTWSYTSPVSTISTTSQRGRGSGGRGRGRGGRSRVDNRRTGSGDIEDTGDLFSERMATAGEEMDMGQVRTSDPDRQAMESPVTSLLFSQDHEPLSPGKAKSILKGEGGDSDIETMMCNMMVHLSNKMDLNQRSTNDQLSIHNTMMNSFSDKLQTVSDQSETNTLKISQLQNDQDDINTRLEKLELYSRKMNLIITGVPETITNVETWYHDTLLYDLGLKDKDATKPQTHIDFDIIHRIGTIRKPIRNPSSPTRLPPRPRRILVKFKTRSDREAIWKVRSELSGTDMYIEEHLPDSYEKKRKPLHNIASIARKKGKIIGKEIKATVLEDYLLLDGKRYTSDQLDYLPPMFDDAKHHCLITDQQVSFLGFLCPLSNFYACTFKYKGETFTSSEQFIQVTKARLFPGNEYLESQIMNTHEPAKIKNLGHRIRNYDDDTWKTEVTDTGTLYGGILAKFTQCPTPFHFLKKTGTRRIVEASRSDTLFGVGQSVGSPTILNPDTFRGKNLQGSFLMTIRDEISTMTPPTAQ